MRFRRFRFTIGRLMAIVLLAGLVSWGIYILIAMREPTMPEQQALADYSQAKLNREVAEYALREYTEGVYKQDLSTLDGQIALARSNLERATDRARWSDDMVLRDQKSKSSNVADHLALNKARFELEQSQTKREVLLKYTKDKTVKELQSEIEKAREDERARLATYQSERFGRFWRILGL